MQQASNSSPGLQPAILLSGQLHRIKAATRGMSAPAAILIVMILQLLHDWQATQPVEMYPALGHRVSVSCGLSQHFQPLIILFTLEAYFCLGSGGHHSLLILAC